MKSHSLMLCFLLGLVSSGCSATSGDAKETDKYGLLPFSTEVTNADYQLLRGTNVTAEALAALQKGGLDIELATSPDESVGVYYMDGMVPLNLTLGLIEDDKIKQWLTQKTEDNGYRAIIFGHLIQEGERFRVVMRIHRNGITGYATYGEDKEKNRRDITPEVLAAMIQAVAQDISQALVESEAKEPLENPVQDAISATDAVPETVQVQD